MASITDKFPEATSGTRPSPASLTAQKGIGDGTITVDSTAGWATNTATHFIIYQIDTSGNRVAGTQTDWKGIVTSGTAVGTLTLKAGTDQVYPIGSAVIAAPTAAWADDVVEGISVHTNQDGTLKTDSVGTSQIADDAVTTVKIPDNAVTTAKIPDDAITSAKLVGIDKSNLTTDSNPYKFMAYRSSAFTWGNNVFAYLTCNAEIFDTNSNYDTSTGRYTAPVDGYYYITAIARGNTKSGSGMYVGIYRSGAELYLGGFQIPVGYTGAFGTSCSAEGIVYMTAGQYVQMGTYGAANTGHTGYNATRFGGYLISRT